MTVKAGALCTSILKINVSLKCAALNALTSLFPSPFIFILPYKGVLPCSDNALTARDEYCFTKVACLLALYIKRARANIILLWIFMGTKRPLASFIRVALRKRMPEYFAYFTILYLFIYLSTECAKCNKKIIRVFMFPVIFHCNIKAMFLRF